jgi:hypothetical protein
MIQIELEKVDRKNGIKKENNYYKLLAEKEYQAQIPKETLEQKQRKAMEEVFSGVWKTSKEFDLDTNKDDSVFDRFVADNVVQKTLEDDQLIFMEGQRPSHQPGFISKQDFDNELIKPENWDVISAGDYQEEFEEMFKEIDERKKPKPGMFEKRPYFDKIFPSLKIQKPGYDLYGSSTIILSLTAVYVFMFYNQITVDMSVFSYLKGQSSIFGGEMAMVILFIISIILLERYTNRSDTKAEVSKRMSEDLQ